MVCLMPRDQVEEQAHMLGVKLSNLSQAHIQAYSKGNVKYHRYDSSYVLGISDNTQFSITTVFTVPAAVQQIMCCSFTGKLLD